MSDSHRPSKTWCFRLAALLLGLLPLLVAEAGAAGNRIGCRRRGGGPVHWLRHDTAPFRAERGWFRTSDYPHTRFDYFRPESFAAKPASNEFRIFCLGGSTVQGRPYAIETSFTTWLELSLQAADPSRRWEVVNCGGISYASYRLVPILKELLQYDPDLFVIYTGHNEFLESRTLSIGDLRAPTRRNNPWLGVATRVYSAVRQAWLQLAGTNAASPDRDTLPADVDAILDHYGGLADYTRDDVWREKVVEHYRFNLLRMIQLARGAGNSGRLRQSCRQSARLPSVQSRA